MPATTDCRPPRMMIISDVLESAKDNGDELVVAACRRLIRANTLGWRKHADPADFRLVMAFAE
jgi:hypothetical protein